MTLKTKHRLLTGLWFVTFLPILITIIIVDAWLFLPYNVVKITSDQNNVKVNQKIYHIGDQIKYTFSYCKYHDVTARVDRALIDGTRILFTSMDSNLPTGCHTVTPADLFIPNGANFGINKIEITAHYQLNPFREQTVELMTETFLVVKQ